MRDAGLCGQNVVVYDPDATGAVLAALSAALRAVTLGSSLDRVLHQLAASA